MTCIRIRSFGCSWFYSGNVEVASTISSYFVLVSMDSGCLNLAEISPYIWLIIFCCLYFQIYEHSRIVWWRLCNIYSPTHYDGEWFFYLPRCVHCLVLVSGCSIQKLSRHLLLNHCWIINSLQSAVSHWLACLWEEYIDVWLHRISLRQEFAKWSPNSTCPAMIEADSYWCHSQTTTTMASRLTPD